MIVAFRQENTCAGFSLIIKVHQNIGTLVFFTAPIITKTKLFISVLLHITEKSSKCFHSADIMSNTGNSGDGLQKSSKSNETKILFQSCQEGHPFSTYAKVSGKLTFLTP